MFPIAECGLNVLPEVEWSIERAVGENPNFFIRCPILDQIEFVLRFQKNGCRGNPLKKKKPLVGCPTAISSWNFWILSLSLRGMAGTESIVLVVEALCDEACR